MFPSDLEKEFEENTSSLCVAGLVLGVLPTTLVPRWIQHRREEKSPYRARSVSIQLPGHSDFGSWSYWIRLSMTAQSLMFTTLVILKILDMTQV